MSWLDKNFAITYEKFYEESSKKKFVKIDSRLLMLLLFPLLVQNRNQNRVWTFWTWANMRLFLLSYPKLIVLTIRDNRKE